MTPVIKLLLFDLDGTLADTSQDITNAINYALDPFGKRKFSAEEVKAMVGSGISALLESLVAPGTVQTTSEQGRSGRELATARFIEYYSGHLIDRTHAYPHVRETLSRLAGYKKSVLSNKREALSKRVLEGLGLLGFFDSVLGSDSVKEKKPSPVPITDLMKKFNATRHETVIIGDSNYDIEAGRAAGITTIAVTYGFRHKDTLTGADYLIDSFDELPALLLKVNKDLLSRTFE